ncbi:MAG TPA: hypothetical protein VGS19_14560 [Streptosporangiaceae bacterium]|nr:hypothetical protein [Streptosporangiaceae bacterium]
MASRSRVGRKMVLAVGGTLAVVAGSAVGVGYLSSASGTSLSPATTHLTQAEPGQVARAEAAFTGAVRTDYAVGGASSTATSTQAQVSPVTAPVPPSPAQVSAAKKALAKYFTASETLSQISGMHASRDIGAGTTGIKFLHVALAPSTAIIEAQVATWSKMGGGKSHVTMHHGLMDYTATLQLTSGHWLVKLLVGSCVTGC